MITQFLDCNFNPSKNVTVLYSGQVKNEIHQSNSKIHQSRAIGHHLLFAIILCCLVVPQHVHGQLTYTSELSPLTHKTNTCTCFKEDNQTKFSTWSTNRNNFYDCNFCRHKALKLEKAGTTFSSFNQLPSLIAICSYKQQTFVMRQPFCPKRLKKLCICTASLVLTARLTMQKHSFLNLLGQNGHHLTKVYRILFQCLTNINSRA